MFRNCCATNQSREYLPSQQYTVRPVSQGLGFRFMSRSEFSSAQNLTGSPGVCSQARWSDVRGELVLATPTKVNNINVIHEVNSAAKLMTRCRKGSVHVHEHALQLS